MKEHCVVCGTQTEDMYTCQSCADIEDFGYPSFPAYALVEQTGEKTEEKKVLQLVG
ncbi:hypothetical protein JQN58_21315 [Aneurinibacillus sp. BA2021]|nr:hypothetical protein [Aneurinibacillus sp. BA2021]